MNGRILIVEDDRSFGLMLQKWFERSGFPATLCSGMVAAQEALSQSEPFQLVLSDLRLPDGDGIMLLSWLNEKRLSVPVIIMTGYGEVQTAVSAIKLGAFDFLEKPINPDILTKKIEAAFEAKRERLAPVEKPRPERKYNKEAKVFVEGQSPLSLQMYTHIDLVAPTQMAVMVIGDSGTGKEHVARLIHTRSNRSAGPFIAVDCGSLSIELAPSELFGHKKGSFTSAIEDKTGFFREAHGGTLFLDEVGNLPYGVQMQLLRSLQEKKVRPVGTSTDLDVDVRIITATNENLEKAIEEGNFREDLYHRLNEFMIRVPSLRECVEDIPSYAAHFREEANRELGREVAVISPDALAVLKNYHWPGNLRELRNVIRRAVLFTRGDIITAESLPLLTTRKEESLPKMDLSLSVEPEEEKERILRALEQVKGNKTKAAILLQIDRKTLYNKMHQYNIGL
ncbi:sigma-54 dependent transcriptional regulator [Proteiniphilum sp. X52]|uniref:sigma-54-dependent transcriptional regulator n=1 Tax=Proteiniphilum sp. X52 TaxID=2382159 RepID=UPI000F0A7607|nr:sigma-54 dependent transcriptional regulator [Proteiniphilum sp. X52]RNC64332.1 sigma-54-dependent Fis family transcriptional regulator [Proteiniphilum sp. X52]